MRRGRGQCCGNLRCRDGSCRRSDDDRDCKRRGNGAERKRPVLRQLGVQSGDAEKRQAAITAVEPAPPPSSIAAASSPPPPPVV